MKYVVRYRDEHNRRVFVIDPVNPRRAFETPYKASAEAVADEFKHDYSEVEIIEFEPGIIPLA